MLKTVKNGSGIRVDPPPVFSKFPHFPVFWGGYVPKVLETWEMGFGGMGRWGLET